MHCFRHPGRLSKRHCLHNADVQRRVPKLRWPADDTWIVQVRCVETINVVVKRRRDTALPSPKCQHPTCAASATAMPQPPPANGTAIEFTDNSAWNTTTQATACQHRGALADLRKLQNNQRQAILQCRGRCPGTMLRYHAAPHVQKSNLLNSTPILQAAGDLNLRDLTNSKTSAPRPPSGDPEVVQRATPSTNAQHAQQPSTLAILSLHPTEEGAGTTKSYSAVAHNYASSVPARSPAGRPAAIAGSSLEAAGGAHVSMASQFAQQARPPVQPDLSTADNYAAGGGAKPQMSDSVVQPEVSLAQHPTRRGAGSAAGGSRAASRGGGSGGRGGGGGGWGNGERVQQAPTRGRSAGAE